VRYVGSVKALSLDLRQRIADALDAQQSQASVARRFDVSLSSVERLARKRRQGHSLEPGKSPGKKPLVAHEQQQAFEQLAASRTNWTLQTLAHAWQQQGGETLSQATVLRTLRRIGFAYKKSAASPVNATRTSAKRVPD
jgi:transposase